MGKLAERSVKAQENLDVLETAIDRTQSALRAAERADQVTTKAVAKSRRVFKLVLILTVVGVAVVVAKKLMGGPSTPSGNPDPYGSSSTDN